MNKKERASYIIKILERLYPNPPIPLSHKDPFSLLIAVMLSARSTDKKVNEITPKLFLRAPTPEKMILLSIEEIKEMIKEIGLSNTKAKNIWNLSKMIVEKYHSKVPDTFEELESLPGVGHKTASVVMAQAYKKEAFPVDTHIHRLMKKWKLSSGKNVYESEKDAKKIFPKKLWSKIHLQIIYYGRQYSPARGWRIEKDIITEQLNKFDQKS